MKETVVKMRSHLLTTIATLMTTAFGLIAALAWNEAIILELFPQQSGVTGLLIYAVLITIIAVVATIIIARAIAKPTIHEVRIAE